MNAKKELSVIIPTYNEKENISLLLSKIFFNFKRYNINGEVIIVDDNSPDGTRVVVESLKEKYKSLKIINRKEKLGLSSAVIAGFNAANSDIYCVMDADLSHSPDRIPIMWDLIKKEKADFVIGSRYISGGKIMGWNVRRRILSRGAVLLSRMFTSIKDSMSGFFMIKKECLNGVKLDSKGFKILLEILVKAKYKIVKEMPITFINRKKGESKAGIKEIFFYLSNILSYLSYKKDILTEFFRFALVGFIGTLINLVILYSLTSFIGIYYIFSAVIAFVIAASINFILNKTWTFREKIKEDLYKKYLQFFFVSLVSLGFNLAFLYIFTEFLGLYYLVSQAIAIGLVLIINFLGNKIWTFNN